MNQQEILKAEFNEDTERADNRVSIQETQKGKDGVSPVFRVWGFYLGQWSSARVFSGIQ